VPAEAEIRFLIATVPDPKRTHLALYFDRSVESIISAAEASGYTLEQFWVPWSSQAEHDLLLLGSRTMRKRPGTPLREAWPPDLPPDRASPLLHSAASRIVHFSCGRDSHHGRQ
jgi:hypothetical protein